MTLPALAPPAEWRYRQLALVIVVLAPQLFDSLKGRQGADDIPPEIASLGEAIWLHTDLGPSSYLLRDGRTFVIDAVGPEVPPRLAADDEVVAVFVCAARNLSCPEILEALPPRPSSAMNCVHCSGTRWWQPPGKWSGPGKVSIVCPQCSGRGWTD